MALGYTSDLAALSAQGHGVSILAVALFMFVFADKLGIVIYDSREAGHYIRLLAPLVPLFHTP